jgi:iron complex outermembrane receptor protein
MNVGISRWSRISILAMSCVAALVCVEVRAQDKADALEEVVVTAKRRSEDVQTSSISATVLNQDLLESKGVVDLYALQYPRLPSRSLNTAPPTCSTSAASVAARSTSTCPRAS